MDYTLQHQNLATRVDGLIDDTGTLHRRDERRNPI